MIHRRIVDAMRPAFSIRLDNPARLSELERLFTRAGVSAFADGDSLHVLLHLEEPCTDEQAYDEVQFAVRAAVPEGSFTIERRPDSATRPAGYR